MKRDTVIADGSHYKLYPGLAAKVGSILVHVEEGLDKDGHPFDWEAVRALLKDPDVQGWLAFLGPLVPRKRT